METLAESLVFAFARYMVFDFWGWGAFRLTVGLCEPAGAFSAGCGLGGMEGRTKPVLSVVAKGWFCHFQPVGSGHP
jgi:hypothetical protein